MSVNKIALAMVGALAFAANTAMAEKLAFVETARVLQESTKVKSIKDKIKKEFGQRDEQLVAEAKQLSKLKEKLSKDAAIMSEDESKRLEQDIVARTRKLKSMQGEFQEDVSLRQNEELGKLRKVIAEVIDGIAKKEGYDMVLDTGVIWASDKVNITSQVLKALDK